MTQNVYKSNNNTNVRIIRMRQIATHFFLSSLWKLSPKFTRRIIKKLFFKPAAYPTSRREKQYLDKAATFQTKIHNKNIRYWQWGHGPGILFVHGWNGRGVQFSCFFDALLKAGYSVITFDAPAHGASEGEHTNYFEFSDAVRHFLNPAHGFHIQGVVAHSLGASAVINALSKENFSGDAVLIAPALKLKELLYNTFNYFGIPQTIYQTIISEIEKQYGYNLHRDNPCNLVQKISARVLIVHDKNDLTVPYLDSKDLTEKTDTVSLFTSQGLGHKRLLKDKSTVNYILQYIFEQLSHDHNPQRVQL